MNKKLLHEHPLAIARKRARLTQTELARRAGVSQSVIARYEGGRKLMREDTIRKLAAALGVEPGEII